MSATDLFNDEVVDSEVLPNDIYAEALDGNLHYVGSLRLPPAIPTELVVEYEGWNYVFKLDSRYIRGEEESA